MHDSRGDGGCGGLDLFQCTYDWLMVTQLAFMAEWGFELGAPRS